MARIDPPETDRPIAMDDVDRSLRELPEMARSLAEGSGHHINGIFFNEPVQAFVSPKAINYRRFVTAGMGAKFFHGTMSAQKEPVLLVASSGPTPLGFA